jgi:hypothetical protein
MHIIIHTSGGLIQEVFYSGKGKVTEVIEVEHEVEKEDANVEYVTVDGTPAVARVVDRTISELPKKCDVTSAMVAFKYQDA